jgi:N-acetylglutamate synthase-like GNAT family acetyltransferase
MRCGHPTNEPFDRSAITIRAARPEDARVIAQLSEQLGYPGSSEDILNRLSHIKSDESNAVYVAELTDKQVIGWVHIHTGPLIIADEIAEIKGIVVEEKYRDKGAGKLLMAHAEEWAREKGCKVIWVSSNTRREGVHYFYQRIGYDNVKISRIFHKTL